MLLDTNAVIALLKGVPAFVERLTRHEPADFGLSAVVLHELYFGAFRSRRAAENLVRIDGLRFEVVEMDREDARHAGEIRALLAGIGRPIGPYDALIAGQAIARGLALVTHNTREFERIPMLRVEDWE